jgi:DNA-binding MarR family transcriptional regulator
LSEDFNVTPIGTNAPAHDGRAAALVHEIIDRARELHSMASNSAERVTVSSISQSATTHGQFARLLLRERRDRDLVIAPDMLGDPAWDMLLDLFCAGEEEKSIPVSSLCLASGVPPTTALRWMALMVEKQLIERLDDHRDKRRVNITLMPETRSALIGYLERVAAARGIGLVSLA